MRCRTIYFLLLILFSLIAIGWSLVQPSHLYEPFQIIVGENQQWCDANGTCYQVGDGKQQMAQELIRFNDTYGTVKQECTDRMNTLENKIQTIQSKLKTEPALDDGPCVDPETGTWGVRIKRFGKACIPSKDAKVSTDRQTSYTPADTSRLFTEDQTPCYEKEIATIPYLNEQCKQHFQGWGLKAIVPCPDERVRGQCAPGYENGANQSIFNATTLPCKKREDLMSPDMTCSLTYPTIVPIGEKRIYYGKEGGCVNDKGQYDNTRGRLVCSPVYRSGYIRYRDKEGRPIYATESCFAPNQTKDMDNECKRLYTASSGYESSSSSLNCPVNMVRGICSPVLL